MADSTSIKCETFGDIISIAANRCNIIGSIQPRDDNLLKGAANEFYMRICTERNWSWRHFDRDYVFKKAVTTGTVNVTNGSREAIFTGLALGQEHAGLSIKINGRSELYRLIGIDTDNNSAFISAPYVGPTNETATFKLYQYEFPLPPDCDNVIQVYTDTGYYMNDGNYSGELDFCDNSKFNRLLSNQSGYSGTPNMWTVNGRMFAETLPPLDEMILDYDFLADDAFSVVEKIRFLPIEPNEDTLVHVNYSIQIEDMKQPTDKPILPLPDRWVLVHNCVYEWAKKNGQAGLADRAARDRDKILKEMRSEFKKQDAKPRFVIDGNQYKRKHGFRSNKDLFYISRRREY